MLLWTSLLCLFSATIVASEFLPEILASYDPGSTFKPLKKALSLSENPRVIRGLLVVRQTNCPTGYMECTNVPGECCAIGGVCCTSGGGGCCDPGYYCTVISGQPGCCQNGSVCNSIVPECTNSGYAPCPADNFCCPIGYQCFRDSSNTPQCSLSSSGVPSSGVPSTLTGTGPQSLPSVTFVQSSISSIPQSPSTVVVSTSTPTSTSNNGGTGAASSALSVGVDVLLSLFAGVGALAFLF